ncbi:unnamed protein product [Cuscuta campestris]|uniref:DUF6598 domain-containing protein n=1 Tax=Cuscuta campestris TaxID=132261 RepID=A0A484LEC7_9ASTE|nr:unnamed protein product [Cuscuta campestris]
MNTPTAQLVLENGHWMPPHDVLALIRPFPDEEGRHRDKRPKNHHPLLLPDAHFSDILHFNIWDWESIVTVECITVKHIKHGTCAKIYGNVIAFDDHNQQVLFRRKPCESDAKKSGDDLKLKGPHFSALDAIYWGSIVINLLEDRGDGRERVFARGLIDVEEDGYFEVDVESDGGVVSVVYASVQDAVWAQVCVGGLQNMRVCGCIKARREIAGVRSEFLMFTKSSDNCVDVGPDGIFRLDRSVVVASKRAGLTISVSLNLCHGDDDEWTWCVVQKDLVFDAVFKKEAQSIHDVFGGKVTVSLAYNDIPGLHCDAFDPYDNDDEWGVGGRLYDDTMEVIQRQMMGIRSQ